MGLTDPEQYPNSDDATGKITTTGKASRLLLGKPTETEKGSRPLARKSKAGKERN